MQNSSKTFLRAVNAIPADSQAAGTTTGTGFNRIGFDHATFVLTLGTLGTSGTVDVKVQESDTLGSGYADVTSAAFSQKTQAGTDMSGLVYVGSMDLRGRKKFLRAICVVGTATSEVGCVALLHSAQTTERCTAAQTASEAKVSLTADFEV